MLMRGGSSKGAYFLGDDLPVDIAERDDLLLRIMGSPDARQVDGIGGGHPLTSKVALVCASSHPEADVDYLFLQVDPGKATITDRQTCGNLLAGVAPFAIERRLISPEGDTTRVRIRSVNPTEAFATAHVRTPAGRVTYDGDELMAGTPFAAAPIPIEFAARPSPIFPSGQTQEHISGIPATCVNAGMPVVLVAATDLGLTGSESPSQLEANERLCSRVELIRIEAAMRMGLGDVRSATVPKICIISPPVAGGTLNTRTFIPHRVHTAIGVLGAVSVAAAILADGTIAAGFNAQTEIVRIEHPSGVFDLAVTLDGHNADARLRSSTVVRTARKLMDGTVWPRTVRIPDEC
jgi:4-oxalomesaconate tautomerase